MEKDRALAAFGQIDAEILSDVRVVGSLRYTDEHKEYSGGSFEIDPFGVSRITLVFPNVAGAGLFGEPEYDDDDVSGSISINWRPTDDTLLYASASKGYKSGGFDGSGITEPSSFTPFNAEKVWGYEVGVRSSLGSDAIDFAGSAFYYAYTDQQVLALVDLGGGLLEAVIVNAAASEVYGVDLEAEWRPVDSLKLAANVTFLHSEITNWESADPAEIAARVGNEIPGTPEISLSASATYDHHIKENWKLRTSLWATYTDAVFRDIENKPELRSDNYALLNGRVELMQSSGEWSAYLFAKNILDNEYITSIRSLVGMEGAYFGQPRTFGGGLRYEF